MNSGDPRSSPASTHPPALSKSPRLGPTNDVVDHEGRGGAGNGSRAMDNFRALVLKLATPLMPLQRSLIEQRLHDFSDSHIPDHPPYAAMIQRALQELNQGEGSTEEAVSEFIRTHFDKLPWAHSTILKHHLQKLCESGDIVLTSNNHYLSCIGFPNPGSKPFSSVMPSDSPCSSPSLGTNSITFSGDCSSSNSDDSLASTPCYRKTESERSKRRWSQWRGRGRPPVYFEGRGRGIPLKNRERRGRGRPLMNRERRGRGGPAMNIEERERGRLSGQHHGRGISGPFRGRECGRPCRKDEFEEEYHPEEELFKLVVKKDYSKDLIVVNDQVLGIIEPNRSEREWIQWTRRCRAPMNVGERGRGRPPLNGRVRGRSSQTIRGRKRGRPCKKGEFEEKYQVNEEIIEMLLEEKNSKEINEGEDQIVDLQVDEVNSSSEVEKHEVVMEVGFVEESNLGSKQGREATAKQNPREKQQNDCGEEQHWPQEQEVTGNGDHLFFSEKSKANPVQDWPKEPEIELLEGQRQEAGKLNEVVKEEVPLEAEAAKERKDNTFEEKNVDDDNESIQQCKLEDKKIEEQHQYRKLEVAQPDGLHVEEKSLKEVFQGKLLETKVMGEKQNILMSRNESSENGITEESNGPEKQVNRLNADHNDVDDQQDDGVAGLILKERCAAGLNPEKEPCQQKQNGVFEQFQLIERRPEVVVEQEEDAICEEDQDVIVLEEGVTKEYSGSQKEEKGVVLEQDTSDEHEREGGQNKLKSSRRSLEESHLPDHKIEARWKKPLRDGLRPRNRSHDATCAAAKSQLDQGRPMREGLRPRKGNPDTVAGGCRPSGGAKALMQTRPPNPKTSTRKKDDKLKCDKLESAASARVLRSRRSRDRFYEI